MFGVKVKLPKFTTAISWSTATGLLFNLRSPLLGKLIILILARGTPLPLLKTLAKSLAAKGMT